MPVLPLVVLSAEMGTVLAVTVRKATLVLAVTHVLQVIMVDLRSKVRILTILCLDEECIDQKMNDKKN